MNKIIIFLSIVAILLVGSCKKDAGPATNYVQVEQNGRMTYYSVNRASWYVTDTGALRGKHYSLTAFQAFTDSLNYVTIDFRDNTTPNNNFCPTVNVFSDLNAPSSGCSDSASNCSGFLVGYFSTASGQFNTTADSTSPKAQLTLFSCQKGFRQLSGNFQCRVVQGSKVIALTNGQFNDVVFTDQ